MDATAAVRCSRVRKVDLDLAAAEWVLGRLPPGALQRLAWEAQARGHDGPAIRALAAEEWSTRGDVGGLVERAASEMGLPWPTLTEAARRYARHVAGEIASG